MAVAAEWEWQSGRSVRPFTMPLMALVATAVDQMSQPEVRDLHVRKLLEHFHADVVLCRAEPGALADHQAAAHEPILRWARAELGDVRPSDSIFGADIPEEVMRAAEARLRSMDAFELTAAFRAAASAKSLLVGSRSRGRRRRRDGDQSGARGGRFSNRGVGVGGGGTTSTRRT